MLFLVNSVEPHIAVRSIPSAGAIVPAGAIATIAAATTAAATTKPDFADDNLGPDSTDSALPEAKGAHVAHCIYEMPVKDS